MKKLINNIISTVKCWVGKIVSVIEKKLGLKKSIKIYYEDFLLDIRIIYEKTKYKINENKERVKLYIIMRPLVILIFFIRRRMNKRK